MSQSISTDCMKEAIALLESKGYRVCGEGILWTNVNAWSKHLPAKYRDNPDYSLSFVPAWSPKPDTLKCESVAELLEKIAALPIAEMP